MDPVVVRKDSFGSLPSYGSDGEDVETNIFPPPSSSSSWNSLGYNKPGGHTKVRPRLMVEFKSHNNKFVRSMNLQRLSKEKEEPRREQEEEDDLSPSMIDPGVLRIPQRVHVPEEFPVPPRAVLSDVTFRGKGQALHDNVRELMHKLKGSNRTYTKALPGIEDFQMLARSSRRSKNAQKEAVAHLGQAILYDNKEDYMNSIRCYTRCLDAAMAIKHKKLQEIAYNGLAAAHHFIEDYKRAIHFSKRHRRVADNSGKIIALSNEGLAHRMLGDIERAQEYHNRALEVSLLHKDEGGESLACGQLSMDCIMGGASSNSKLANGGTKELVKRHLEICMKTQDVRAASVAHQHLGSIEAVEGNYMSAFSHFERSRDLAIDSGDQSLGNIHKCNIGIVRGNQRLQEYFQNMIRGKSAPDSSLYNPRGNLNQAPNSPVPYNAIDEK